MNVSRLVQEIERALGYDQLYEGNMNAYDVLEIVKKFEQPQINENQQIVLNWLKEEKINSGLTLFDCIYSFIYGSPKDVVTQIWSELNTKEEAQVLEEFGKWELEQVAMTRKIKIWLNADGGEDVYKTIEVPNGATDEYIDKKAKEAIFEAVNWGWWGEQDEE